MTKPRIYTLILCQKVVQEHLWQFFFAPDTGTIVLLFLTPVRVHDEQRAEDGVGHRVGHGQRQQHPGDAQRRHHALGSPHTDVVAAAAAKARGAQREVSGGDQRGAERRGRG